MDRSKWEYKKLGKVFFPFLQINLRIACAVRTFFVIMHRATTRRGRPRARPPKEKHSTNQ